MDGVDAEKIQVKKTTRNQGPSTRINAMCYVILAIKIDKIKSCQ